MRHARLLVSILAALITSSLAASDYTVAPNWLKLLHLSLDGQFLGVVATGLLLPAAIVIDGDHAIVGELTGRVTVLDKAGAVLSPHGVALNARGDLFVSELSAFGRVHRFNRP